MRYKVRFMMDNTYEVTTTKEEGNENELEESVYQGSLADCEAYIRLKEGGYM